MTYDPSSMASWIAAVNAALGDPNSNTTAAFNGTVGATTPAAGLFTTVGATGVTSLANGAVGAPALTFTSDTDTGLYRTAANSLGVAAGGALVSTFTSTGLQGAVGATTPAAGAFTTLAASGTATTTGNVDLQGSVFALDNIELAITAHAGGTQAAAYALTKVISVVGTVGTAADSVKLPAPTIVGQIAVVINNAASNSMQVFGSGTDTINGVATATGVAQAAGKTGLYVATSIGTAAAWFRLLSA